MENLLDKPLGDVIFVALDVETTGLTPQFGDRICEIGLLRFKGSQILDSFSTLINPGRPISLGASAVSGITDDMVVNAPSFKDVAGRILHMLDGAAILAHNAQFDLGFIAHRLRALRLLTLANPVVDTLLLARRNYHFRSNSLGNIARELGIGTQGQHRAMGDAAITMGVFERFISDFLARGIRTLGDLIDLQGGSIPSPKMPEIPLPPQLEEAIKGEKRLWLRYCTPEGTETRRVVEPLEVTLYRDYIYLVALCELRGQQRTFRLDRILEMHPVAEENERWI